MSDILNREKIYLGLGLSFVALGVVFNEWVLGLVFSPDGRIESSSIRGAIWAYSFFMVLIGLLVLKGRQKPSSLKIPINLALFVFTVAISVLFCEFGLRVLGYGPAVLNRVMTPEPEDRLLAAHPVLGHIHRPGLAIKTFSRRKGYKFTVTHSNSGLRITRPLDTYAAEDSREQMWIFGCSFTYGWSLNDDETYPWLLQQEFPDYEVVNHGIVAYGTLQSLLQFREALDEGQKPEIAILAYASFHDERNTNLRSRQKLFVAMGMGILPQPYARLEKDGSFTYSLSGRYREFPFMRHSALTHMVEKAYNRMQDWFVHSHEVSKAIVKEFAELCQENGVELVVAGIMNDALTSDMLEYAKGLGVLTVDISVDLDVEGNRNLPYDTHPSAVANKQYARKLEDFLKGTVLSETSMQD